MYDIMFATRTRALVTIVLLSLAAVLAVAGWVAVTSDAVSSIGTGALDGCDYASSHDSRAGAD